MKIDKLSRMAVFVPAVIAFVALCSVVVSAQSTRRTRKATPIPAPTATPQTSEPLIISRAEDFPDENSQAIPPDPNAERPAAGADAANLQTLEDLGRRIRNLEATRKPDPDEKQKRLLLNLDILTRAEQRAESLRKQLFEMIEKENATKTKLDSLEYELRPEVIERSTAMVGSLRPEEIRASRRKSLESERANLQTLLTEIQRNRTAVDLNLQRADALVERLRVKLEKEIDTALDDEPENRPEN